MLTILEQRHPFYQAVARNVFYTKRKSPIEVAKDILVTYKRVFS